MTHHFYLARRFALGRGVFFVVVVVGVLVVFVVAAAAAGEAACGEAVTLERRWRPLFPSGCEPWAVIGETDIREAGSEADGCEAPASCLRVLSRASWERAESGLDSGESRTGSR